MVASTISSLYELSQGQNLDQRLISETLVVQVEERILSFTSPEESPAYTWSTSRIVGNRLRHALDGNGAQEDREMLVRALAEHTEDFHEYINVLHSNVVTPPQLDIDVFFGSWEAMGQGFEALGYQLDHPCPWRQIGLAKEEGPEPTVDALGRRVRLLRNLLTAAATLPWAATAEEQLLRAGARVQLARSTCLQELDAVLARRKKSRLQIWPRWLELEPPFLRALPSLLPLGRSAITLTNLSELMQRDAPDLPYTITPARTRELTRRLVGDAGQVAQTLTQLQRQEELMWAPPDRETLQRLLAGLQGAHQASPDPPDLRHTLLVALDVLPGCDKAAAVLDVFSHPALDRRWDPLHKATRFVLQPVRTHALHVCTLTKATVDICYLLPWDIIIHT